MSATNHRFGIAVIAMVAVVGLMGCGSMGGGSDPVFVGSKVTGGGWLPSASGPPGKANFGFNAAHCEEGVFSGQFNYHDKHAPPPFQPGGVKMHGSVAGAKLCSSQDSCLSSSGCPDGSIEVAVDYRSTNPRFPGEGRALACVDDNGEGSKAPADTGRIKVTTGPFAPYANEGFVQGNIQTHTCTCTDGEDNDGDGLTDRDDPACTDPITEEFNPNLDEG